jgi:hypothetical protein
VAPRVLDDSKGRLMPYTDETFLPVATTLLGCLSAAVADLTDAPNVVGLRYGPETVLDIAQNADLCCEGFAWVRMGVAAPHPLSADARCNVSLWLLDLEMGHVFCAPMGDDQNIVTEPEHTATAAALAESFAALRKAICCFGDLEPGYHFTVGPWTPNGPEGGCVGSTITVTVDIPGRDNFPA